MISIYEPISAHDLDHVFLRKLFVLAKTYASSSDDYEEIMDLVIYAFLRGAETPPSDIELEGFKDET